MSVFALRWEFRRQKLLEQIEIMDPDVLSLVAAAVSAREPGAACTHRWSWMITAFLPNASATSGTPVLSATSIRCGPNPSLAQPSRRTFLLTWAGLRVPQTAEGLVRRRLRHLLAEVEVRVSGLGGATVGVRMRIPSPFFRAFVSGFRHGRWQ